MADPVFFETRMEFVAELDAIGVTEEKFLPQIWIDRIHRFNSTWIPGFRESLRLVSLHEEYEGRVKYMENMVRRVTTEVVIKQLEARAVVDVLAQLAKEGKRPKRKRHLKTLGTEKNKMK